MDYITAKEASEKWGVTPRRVNYYCAGGRIPSAVKMAGVWLIPKTSFARAGFYQILCIALLAQMGYTHNRNS